MADMAVVRVPEEREEQEYIRMEFKGLLEVAVPVAAAIPMAEAVEVAVIMEAVVVALDTFMTVAMLRQVAPVVAVRHILQGLLSPILPGIDPATGR
jgi:hypothetical protein